MWELTEEAKKEIEALYLHFFPLITEASNEELYDRIYCGYCYGEGGWPLWTVEEWNRVFGLKKDKQPDTVFDNWDDYRKYKGDWHIKIKYIKR